MTNIALSHIVVQPKNRHLFFEYQINGGNQKHKSKQVVPFESLSFERNRTEHHKHHKRDYFLNNFELNEREWTSVSLKSNTIGRHLKTIFEEGYPPTDQHYTKQRECCKPRKLFHFEVTIPSEGHKHVRYYQQYDGDNGRNIHKRCINMYVNIEPISKLLSLESFHPICKIQRRSFLVHKALRCLLRFSLHLHYTPQLLF